MKIGKNYIIINFGNSNIESHRFNIHFGHHL